MMQKLFIGLLTLILAGCGTIHVRIEGMPGIAAKVAGWQQANAPSITCPAGQEAYWAMTGSSSVSPQVTRPADVRNGKILRPARVALNSKEEITSVARCREKAPQ